MRRGLALGRERHKEMGVVATRRTDRSDPVGEIGDTAQIEAHVFPPQYLSEGGLTGVQLSAIRGESGQFFGSGEAAFSTFVVTDNEEAGLFKEFAEARNVIREPPMLEPETLRRHVIAEAIDRRVGVLGVDRAAGKNEDTAHELAAHVTSEHKNLVTIWSVT